MLLNATAARFPLMPSGVEHLGFSRRTIVSETGAFSVDAVRR